MRSLIREMTPIRVGAIVTDGGVLCAGCAPDMNHPHVQARNRFALLVYMPVKIEVPEGMPDFPFVGDAHKPPVEINAVQSPDPAAQQFIRMVHRN